MKIGLIGYGRMGRAVERSAVARGHEIGAVLDIDDNPQGAGITDEAFAGIDVAIDFTVPEAVFDNIERVTAIGTPLVVGTTGWGDRVEVARSLVSERGAALVHGANFSIGANLFLRLAAHAALLFDAFDAYDPYVFEHHHRNKLDAPSGTALRAAELVVDAVGRKKHLLTTATDGAIAADVLHVASLRAGGCPGEHRVGFDGDADSVQIVHTARRRRGFAEGAVLAAEWIATRRGFFGFDEVLDAITAERGPAERGA